MKTSIHRDQSGLVGRFIVGWLLIVAILGVGAVDGASIAFTTFRLSDVAVAAASEAASRFRSQQDVPGACQSAVRAVEVQDPEITFVRCRIDRAGVATITVRQEASTLVVGRIDMLKKYGRVTRTEAVGALSV
jgi:hypothetical protein